VAVAEARDVGSWTALCKQPCADVHGIDDIEYGGIMRLRATDISTRRLGDETNVLSLPTSRYYTITGVGTRIVELLGEETSFEDLVHVVVTEYEVDPTEARRDIAAFIERLRTSELLT
jgi:hypothetical protein